MGQKSNPVKIWGLPWHSLFFALYPVLALLGHNIGETYIDSAYRALIVSTIGSLVLLAITYSVLRDWQKAGLVTTWLLVFFFSYGHIYTFLKTLEIPATIVIRHRYLAPVLFVVFGLAIWWGLKQPTHLPSTTSTLNIISIVLLVYPIYQLAAFGIVNNASVRNPNDENSYGAHLPAEGAPPDIYYIILDSYGRQSTLQKVLQYNNEPFLDTLASMGFYIADCSRSNYPRTTLSLASSLNFDYLPALSSEIRPENTDLHPLAKLMKDSAIQRVLDSLGYKTIAFETGYYWSQMEDYDIYLRPTPGAYSALNGFESMLLRTSALSILDDMGIFKDKMPLSDNALVYERTLFALAKLEQLPSVPGPKFVFAHLLIPHTPFVFGPDGEFLVVPKSTRPGVDYEREDYFHGYHNQLVYTDKRIPETLAKIIAESPTPPVIIVQGDHGPGLVEGNDRLGILNAYHLPGNPSGLSKSITPVNTFRIVLNTYFGTHLDLLPDISYIPSNYHKPYDFIEVPDNCSIP